MSTVREIIERLKQQHADLLQGAVYRPDEDEQWDATLEAALLLEEMERKS